MSVVDRVSLVVGVTVVVGVVPVGARAGASVSESDISSATATPVITSDDPTSPTTKAEPSVMPPDAAPAPAPAPTPAPAPEPDPAAPEA